MNQSNKSFYHILAFLIIAVWGTTFISTRVLINSGMRPHEIFFTRFLIAYIGLLIFSHRRWWSNNWKDELWLMAAGITGGSLYFLSENTAVGITLVTNVSFLVCSAPLWTALLSILLTKSQKLTSSLAFGSLLALAGMVLVIYNGSFILKIVPLGDFLALLGAMSWAFYSLIIHKVSPHYSMTFVTRKVFFYGVLTISPLFLVKPWHFSLSKFQEPLILFNLLFLSVLASLVCFYLWNIVLKQLGTVKASNYVYLNPVFTLLGSYLFLGEMVSFVAVIGAAFILSGVYWASKKG